MSWGVGCTTGEAGEGGSSGDGDSSNRNGVGVDVVEEDVGGAGVPVLVVEMLEASAVKGLEVGRGGLAFGASRGLQAMGLVCDGVVDCQELPAGKWYRPSFLQDTHTTSL